MNIRQLTSLLLTTLILSWSLSAFAASGSQFTGPDRDVNGNIVPTPKGEKCVEPVADMRANHMKYLLHKRDETVHQGIRTKKHSLVECINCHVTPDNNGNVARITSDEHFCSSCHRAVSVTLDCFECHADRSVESFSQLPRSISVVQSLTDYLQAQMTQKPHVANSNTF